MSQVPQTSDEVFDSITGHDEMAIAQHFGQTVGDLLVTNPSMYTRALAFVVKRRAGVNDDDARNAVLEMPMKDVFTFFATEADEESGKGEPAPEQEPETSLSGAPEPDAGPTSTEPSPELNETPSSTLRLAEPVEELPAS